MKIRIRYEPPVFVNIGRPYCDDDNLRLYFAGLQKIINDFYYSFHDFQTGRAEGLRAAESLDTYASNLVNCLFGFGCFFDRSPSNTPVLTAAAQNAKAIYGDDFFQIVTEMRNSFAHIHDYYFIKKTVKAYTQAIEEVGTRTSNGGRINIISGCDDRSIFVRGLNGKILELDHANLKFKVTSSMLVFKSKLNDSNFPIEIRGIG